MLYRTLISSFFVAAAFAFSPTARAQTSEIQGKVFGADGQPLQGAEIRFERTDKTSAPSMVKTNAKGSDSSSGLANDSVYKISVVENGKVKSAVTIKTAGDPARVDFDLKPSAGKKVKHFVLVSGTTGSHLAARWIETDENGTPIAGSLNVFRASPELEREMYRRQVNSSGR